MRAELETEVLKGVSRSFYLSLRLLPPAMRRPASIAYLLARLSDTIADSAEIPAADRMEMLGSFRKQMEDAGRVGDWPERLVAATPDHREKTLLRGHRAIMDSLASLSGIEIGLIREVVGIIIGGQVLDLERFGDASASNVISLKSAEELNDYTWRVAGCVGVFWTKLGYATLGGKFSETEESELLRHAGEYGKGLQLVNILRDLPNDLRAGRCYLPFSAQTDTNAMMEAFPEWRAVAEEKVRHGYDYAGKLRSRRLRIASGLPAMIAMETLELLNGKSFEELGQGIKVPRKRVYGMILKSLGAGQGAWSSRLRS